MNKPREYIYFDEVEINSILSQLDNGLTTVIKDLQSALEGDETTTNKSHKIKTEGRLNTKIGGGISTSKGNEEQHVSSKQKVSENAIETVYNDYALNLIIQRLKENQLLKENIGAEDGSFVKITANYSIVDFGSFGNLFSLPFFKQMAGDRGTVEMIDTMFSTYSQVIGETELIHLTNALTFAKPEYFRMDKSQRRMLPFRKTKLTVFGIAEAKLNNNDLNFDFDQEFEKHPELLGSLSSNIAMLLLSEMGIVKQNDRLIKPIAMYF